MSAKKADEDEGAEVVADDDLAEMELEDDADVEAEGWRVGDVSAETPRRRRRRKRRHVDGRQGIQKETPEGTTQPRGPPGTRSRRRCCQRTADAASHMCDVSHPRNDIAMKGDTLNIAPERTAGATRITTHGERDEAVRTSTGIEPQARR